MVLLIMLPNKPRSPNLLAGYVEALGLSMYPPTEDTNMSGFNGHPLPLTVDMAEPLTPLAVPLRAPSVAWP
jgi:hypothetical protein